MLAQNDRQNELQVTAVHHVESEKVWFHTNHHYHWVTYVLSASLVRGRSVI